MTMLNIKQTQQTSSTNLRNSYIIIITITCSPKTEPKIVSSKGYHQFQEISGKAKINIEFHQNSKMPQDFNQNPNRPTYSFLVIFIYWARERQGSIFLAARFG